MNGYDALAGRLEELADRIVDDGFGDGFDVDDLRDAARVLRSLRKKEKNLAQAISMQEEHYKRSLEDRARYQREHRGMLS